MSTQFNSKKRKRHIFNEASIKCYLSKCIITMKLRDEVIDLISEFNCIFARFHNTCRR